MGISRIGKEGPRQRRLGILVIRLLEPHFPNPFHTATALSAPSGHLPLEGKAGDTSIAASQKIFGHRPIYIRGEAATTTLHPESCTLNPAPCTLHPEPCTLNPWNLQNFFRPVSMVEANRQLLFLYDEFIIMNALLC